MVPFLFPLFQDCKISMQFEHLCGTAIPPLGIFSQPATPLCMADSLWMRLREVPWKQYACSPRATKAIPKILENLASRKLPRAMKASHDLWLTLCSSKVYPAAEVTFPFLVEILGISDPAVQGEILDLFLCFAKVPHDENAQDWEKNLRMMLKNEHRFITKLSYSKDEIVAAKARDLLTLLSP